MSALLPIVILGGIAAFAYGAGKKKGKKKSSSSSTPKISYGLELTANCGVVVRDDGPFLELMHAVCAELYPGRTYEGLPYAPEGGAERVLATALKAAFPKCPWPPDESKYPWRGVEGFKQFYWRDLVSAWETKYATLRGEE